MSSRAVGAAVSSRTSRTPVNARVQDLLEQQAALRDLAVAVAEMRAPEVIYELVAKQAAAVAGLDSAAVVRFRVDGVAEIVGSWRMGSKQVGTVLPLDGAGELGIVARTGRAARINGTGPRRIRTTGAPKEPASLSVPGGVAVPIRVRRELWGSLLVVARSKEHIPQDLEERLGIFADLAGLAITNADTSAHLLAQATSDPLTGLLNHRAFQERVQNEVARAQRYERPLALVLLDLDFFKSINDAYGHQAGDAALMQAANLLEEGARAGDVLGRIGGDEFALLLPETTAESALPIAERWAAEFRAAPVGVAAHLTMSAGICDLGQAKDSKELLQLADGALYWAKNQGRDTVVVYSPDVVYELSDSDRADRLQRSQSLISIRSLARSIDAKDSPNEDHSERVAALVRRLAEAASWPPVPVAQLAEAARIHDVGKICIPDEILLKQGSLTAAEYELVKAHAALGGQIARDALSDEQALWIEQHHEQFDGKGYPNGLSGSQISEGAALLALADSWDVMTTVRSYSPAKSQAEALAECISLAGSQFSPTACKALASLF
ncbi:MAG TPA: diguanylate cyclase [Gaiellaceae bacterium]|jgi:diguanylate cyclase (GGDEF)-like protein